MASVIGFIGAILLGIFAYMAGSIWLGILAFFIFGQAQVGWRNAQALRMEADEQARRDVAVSPPPVSPIEPPPAVPPDSYRPN